MKLILFILVALALGKVGAQVYIRQQSIEDTVVAAYRQHAIAACGLHAAKEAKANGGPLVERPLARPEPDVELAIGRPDLDVRIWQTSHEAWSARFQDPFLIVTSQLGQTTTACEYDIRNARVYAFHRLPDDTEGESNHLSAAATMERYVRR
jgi:hypothetical protein